MKRKSIALVLSLGLLGSVTLGSIETVYAEGNKNTTNIIARLIIVFLRLGNSSSTLPEITILPISNAVKIITSAGSKI